MKSKISMYLAVALITSLIVGGCDLISGLSGQAEPLPVDPAAIPAAIPPAPVIPGVPAAAAPVPVAAPAPEAVAVPAAAPVSDDPMAQKMATVKATNAGDKVETSALMTATLAAAGSQSYQVSLPGVPFCHAIIAVGADTISNVDVKLALVDGGVVAADATQGAAAVIPHYCPQAPGLYTVTVSATTGGGNVAVQIFSK